MRFMTPDWPVPARVRALVTERAGGVSAGPYATLNLGASAGDSPACVAENRRLLRERAGLPAEPAWLRQVHGTHVAELDTGTPAWTRSNVSAETETASWSPSDIPAETETAPWTQSNVPAETETTPGPAETSSARIEADAAVTGTPGVVCAVLTADCLPVFLAARDGRRVGVAHAGWRGLAAGVLEHAVAALRVPPGELVAWLGPAIGPGAFEVGADVVAAFRDAGFDTLAAMTPNARGRWQADLYALARVSLARAGVADVHGGGLCTYTESERFFSHRRDGPCGRFGSMIWIE